MEAAFSDDSGSGSEDEEEDDLRDSRVPGRRSQVRWDDIIEAISFAEVRRVLQTVSVTILITIIICALMHLISQCELDDRISDALAGLTQDGARFTTGQNYIRRTGDQCQITERRCSLHHKFECPYMARVVKNPIKGTVTFQVIQTNYDVVHFCFSVSL